jgi:hypothetical protein
MAKQERWGYKRGDTFQFDTDVLKKKMQFTVWGEEQ